MYRLPHIQEHDTPEYCFWVGAFDDPELEEITDYCKTLDFDPLPLHDPEPLDTKARAVRDGNPNGVADGFVNGWLGISYDTCDPGEALSIRRDRLLI